MGPLGNRGSWALVSLLKLKKAYEKRYQGHLMGPPTDPGPSGSARVSKWSFRPWSGMCDAPVSQQILVAFHILALAELNS
ncbi:unnamed protein product, partial [Staurois parvus]